MRERSRVWRESNGGMGERKAWDNLQVLSDLRSESHSVLSERKSGDREQEETALASCLNPCLHMVGREAWILGWGKKQKMECLKRKDKGCHVRSNINSLNTQSVTVCSKLSIIFHSWDTGWALELSGKVDFYT